LAVSAGARRRLQEVLDAYFLGAMPAA